jgi:hypothetical protein
MVRHSRQSIGFEPLYPADGKPFSSMREFRLFRSFPALSGALNTFKALTLA